jgi:hypothetical protein
MKKALILVLLFSVRVIATAQTPVMTVEANNSACEVNAASIDNVANVLRSTKDHLFVIARLGNGESSRDLNILTVDTMVLANATIRDGNLANRHRPTTRWTGAAGA